MINDPIDQEVVDVLNQLLDQIDPICDDCSIRNCSVKCQTRHQRTKDSHLVVYLCDHCAQQRHQDAQQVLEDLESLAHEVEQRLQAIENTERQLDQWRDEQLQKNRLFWDEYRRQVENFSSCRIRTVQYEYTMRQLKTQRLMQRLKRVKYLIEHFDQLYDQLIQLFPLTFLNLISSNYFQNELILFLSTNDEQHSTNDQRKHFLDQIEQFTYLDQILIPGDQFTIDEQFKDDINE